MIEVDDNMAVICPLCHSEAHTLIGKLGAKFWLRCRHCGADHAAPGWWTPDEEAGDEY